MSLPGRKEPGGGEGRVQAERTTRRSPQGQGNGPEGERSLDRCRSPDPGRRCPCGCPQHVDRLGRSLARGVARLAPGWLPTIMRPPIRTVHIASFLRPGTSCAWGCIFSRPGTCRALGDRIPVPDGVERPRPHRNVPDGVERPRPQRTPPRQRSPQHPPHMAVSRHTPIHNVLQVANVCNPSSLDVTQPPVD